MPSLVVALEDDAHASDPQPVTRSPLQRLDIDIGTTRVLRELLQSFENALTLLTRQPDQSLHGLPLERKVIAHALDHSR